MMDILFHGFFVRKNRNDPTRICPMNPKVFNFPYKLHNDIVYIVKKALQFNGPVS